MVSTADASVPKVPGVEKSPVPEPIRSGSPKTILGFRVLVTGVAAILSGSVLPGMFVETPVWLTALLNQGGRLAAALGLLVLLVPSAETLQNLGRADWWKERFDVQFTLAEAMGLVFLACAVNAVVARFSGDPGHLLVTYVLQILFCFPAVFHELRHQRRKPEPSRVRRWTMMGMAYLFVPAVMSVLFLGLYATALAMNHEWRSTGRMLLWMSPACVVTALYARARVR